MTQISSELIAAYLASEYRCDALATPIKVGVHSGELSRILANRAYPSAAFLTAYNPQSQPLAEPENRQRNAKLRAKLDASGYTYFEGEGVDPKGSWPGEPSFLILGISRERALNLALEHGQSAFVFIVGSQPAELVLTG